MIATYWVLSGCSAVFTQWGGRSGRLGGWWSRCWRQGLLSGDYGEDPASWKTGEGWGRGKTAASGLESPGGQTARRDPGSTRWGRPRERPPDGLAGPRIPSPHWLTPSHKKTICVWRQQEGRGAPGLPFLLEPLFLWGTRSSRRNLAPKLRHLRIISKIWYIGTFQIPWRGEEGQPFLSLLKKI